MAGSIILQNIQENPTASSWWVPNAFIEALSQNILSKYSDELSKEMKDTLSMVKYAEGFSLFELPVSDWLSFYDAVRKVQVWQKKVGSVSYFGNPDFFDQYISECDRLISMLEDEIKERDPEYYSENISDKVS